jgi:NADH:ubiquinone oxidoreductase subunit E
MKMAKAGNAGFSKDLNAFIKEWKDKPGNLIMILHRVQEEQGYISRDAAFGVSELTGIPLARIYGVISFYHFFKTQKPGKNQVSVCLGTACYLKGGQDIIDETRSLLKLGEKDISTEDGLFSVEPVRCIGCCGLAPVMSINGDVYGKLTKNQIAGILNKYRSQ